MNEHPIGAWVKELGLLWQAWVRNCTACNGLQAGDVDTLTLFSYHLLLSEPELGEVRHALFYMLVEVLRLAPDDVPHESVDSFAKQLRDWRSTKPRGWRQ